MGGETSCSDSNSSRSESESSSNSGGKNGVLETMECFPQNNEKIIRRVWIIKRSINLKDKHVNLDIPFYSFYLMWYFSSFENLDIMKPEVNVFKIDNETKISFKHWAIILELSNFTFVNIQFGKNGFSLKEFNETNYKGRNILDAILYTWGRKEHPFSFCYLGCLDYEYDKLKKFLLAKKSKEAKKYEECGETYYNLTFRNCQHFACEIEHILFKKIMFWHTFDYYIEEFFNHFFPNIDINALKLKYEKEIAEDNKELYQINLKKIKDINSHLGSDVPQNLREIIVKNWKKQLNQMFGIANELSQKKQYAK